MKLPMNSWMLMGALAGALFFSTSQIDAATNAPIAETTASLSPGAAEVLKLFNAGVEENVLMGFISNTTTAFSLDADDLIYLHKHGMSSGVTTAMLQQDLNNKAKQQPAATSTTPAAFQPAATMQSAATTIPTIKEGEPAVEQFYQALAPYGSWFQLPQQQSWAWQPKEAAANAGWRPYVDGGRWAWTDYGWYWSSDYPWGWAAFHYGRWLNVEKIGWVWIPDTVWAPSWVTWRQTDDYVGWAPLPSDALTDARTIDEPIVTDYDFGLRQEYYTFVPTRYIFVNDVRSHCLPSWRVKEFYKHCKVVNHYAPGKHRGIVNKGIPIDRISDATGKRLTPVPIYGKDDRHDDRRWHGRDRHHGEPRHHAPPGIITPAPLHPGSQAGTGNSFDLRAAPTLRAAPRLRSDQAGTIATAPNPAITPMNPIVPPMTPAVPFNGTPVKTVAKPFAPVAPAGVIEAEHQRHENRRIAARRIETRRREGGSSPTTTVTPIQPAPQFKAAPQVNRSTWSVPANEDWTKQRRMRN